MRTERIQNVSIDLLRLLLASLEKIHNIVKSNKHISKGDKKNKDL